MLVHASGNRWPQAIPTCFWPRPCWLLEQSPTWSDVKDARARVRLGSSAMTFSIWKVTHTTIKDALVHVHLSASKATQRTVLDLAACIRNFEVRGTPVHKPDGWGCSGGCNRDRSWEGCGEGVEGEPAFPRLLTGPSRHCPDRRNSSPRACAVECQHQMMALIQLFGGWGLCQPRWIGGGRAAAKAEGKTAAKTEEKTASMEGTRVVVRANRLWHPCSRAGQSWCRWGGGQ